LGWVWIFSETIQNFVSLSSLQFISFEVLSVAKQCQ